MKLDYDAHEPGTRSVVAIDWGGRYQEVWVANRSNIGNWYTPDAIITGHPHWEDVVERARRMGATLTLLTPADESAYRAGYRAALDAVSESLESAVDGCRLVG